MLLLDTCVCIDFLRGTMPAVLKKLQEFEPHDIGIPSVVEAELYLGALKSARPSENKEKVNRFLFPFDKVFFDSKCAHEYAEIRSALESTGMTIGPNDLMIAAIARAHNASLVTNNLKEFKRVEQLKLECWAEVALS